MILFEQTERTKIPINIKVIQWLWKKDGTKSTFKRFFNFKWQWKFSALNIAVQNRNYIKFETVDCFVNLITVMHSNQSQNPVL